MDNASISVAIADDHTLLRKALYQLLSDEGFNMILEADEGNDLLEKLKTQKPQVVLMDVHMRGMGGLEATEKIKALYPEIKVIGLSQHDDEMTVIRMIRAGARGYLLKDVEPKELCRAIRDVINKGHHYTERVAGILGTHLTGNSEKEIQAIHLTEKEKEFIIWCCSELGYKEIADKMGLSPRTIDGYRETLFEKLNVHSRVGLVLNAIRFKLFAV